MRCTVLKLVTALALGLFTAPSAVEAQPAGKVPRVVGYLTQGSTEDSRSGLDAFRTALRGRINRRLEELSTSVLKSAAAQRAAA